jgi:uncharacterized protein YbcV (DUF1398 family)
MFTIDQITQAHAKVTSGADFPDYIKELKLLGVMALETWVEDSHTEYFGENDFRTISKPMYEPLTVATTSNKDSFVSCLKTHQKGETDYHTFCSGCAKAGIEKWFISLILMTCTYFDKAGDTILVEQIPSN